MRHIWIFAVVLLLFMFAPVFEARKVISDCPYPNWLGTLIIDNEEAVLNAEYCAINRVIVRGENASLTCANCKRVSIRFLTVYAKNFKLLDTNGLRISSLSVARHTSDVNITIQDNNNLSIQDIYNSGYVYKDSKKRYGLNLTLKNNTNLTTELFVFLRDTNILIQDNFSSSVILNLYPGAIEKDTGVIAREVTGYVYALIQDNNHIYIELNLSSYNGDANIITVSYTHLTLPTKA